MPITEFNKDVCGRLGREIEEALKPLAEKHGIVIRYQGGRYAAGQYYPKIECAVRMADGTVETTEVRDFKQWANAFGLEPTQLGQSFTHRGEVFKICGLKPSSKKMPVLASRKDGKTFKFGAELVAKALKEQAA